MVQQRKSLEINKINERNSKHPKAKELNRISAD